MKDIAIFGAGGFGREVLTMIQHINEQKSTYNFIGFFDDGIPVSSIVNGYRVLGGIEELNSWDKELNIVVAIGSPAIKKKVVEAIFNSKINFPTLIHPSVIVGDYNNIRIGKGCLICAYSIITCNIEIKDFVIINLACTVGHDTMIERYCSFMPTVNISGEVLIKEGVYAGTGTKIINQLEIGEWTTIGAGAVVAKALPAYCTAVGVPAKPVKFRENKA